MNLSPTAQATLLLTCYFKKASKEEVKPLTISEWGRFALWLKDKGITPADLLVAQPEPLLAGWHDSKIDVSRILQLLARGHSLALAVEKWQRAGLWVVTRSDVEYPKRLKQRLKTDSPPVLFGCGNRALLNAGGLAVIGSRNASESDLLFTQQVGAKAALENIAIVSGGARGVDETAMLGAIDSGGPVIGILADSLLKAATSAKWRKGLMNNSTVLISPFYPEAGFNAGNAMARNKYIYCLAQCSLVIHSGKKGGTLNGAHENLKKEWVPLWVKPTNDKEAANASLVEKGGLWCANDIANLHITELFEVSAASRLEVNEPQADFFSSHEKSEPEQPALFVDAEPAGAAQHAVTETQTASSIDIANDEVLKETSTEGLGAIELSFYDHFLTKMASLAEKPVTIDDLLNTTKLHKSQLNDWLKNAVEDGEMKKLNRPVRYVFTEKK